MKEQFGVIGAGGWGTAIANLLAGKGYPVSLWVYEKDLCREIERRRRNTLYLPGIRLSEGITPTTSLREAVKGRQILVTASPSHVIRRVVKKAVPYLHPRAIFVSASKGIEDKTLLTVSQVLKEILPSRFHSRVTVISGPSFAQEVARRIPTAVVIAAKEPAVARRVQELFRTPYFRTYTSPDVIGVELGGALKNVVALAAGVSDGLGLGFNTRAALMTRGLAEITRLGVKMGANPLTLSGLAGAGDLILTCTGDLSRNRTVGIKLGKGMKIKEILSRMKMIAEGVKTAKSAYELSRRYQVEMPITEQVYLILYRNKKPERAVSDLMGRDLKTELEKVNIMKGG
ncbi:MAG: NAD(P)H-dependent glycerol-3-phosphate dehydrogenase [Deltaproteobacteria bacterium]|nr:MAG: NAD(P)H-dependent glycerol-3-phosphate dehydrogenase [Deltaproteobacteria bacterium]